ncbi:MAG: phosphohydrolase [Thermoprotei archaeon]|nr:MAG: phosphohydrolase [Thermoprotei archaeon]
MDTRSKLKHLLEKAHEVRDPAIRDVVISILTNPRITFCNVQPKITLEESPAAPRKHHAYPGGLIDHTLSVVLISESIAKIYRNVYSISVDLDLTIATAILHDIFKYYQYERDPVTGGYRPRDDWYLSHEFTIIAELAHRGAPERLVRCLAEVHGTVPFTMIESEIVHLADSIDANFMSSIQDKLWNVCRDIEVETDGRYLATKTFFKVLNEVPIAKLLEVLTTEGKEAMRKFIKKTLGIE